VDESNHREIPIDIASTPGLQLFSFKPQGGLEETANGPTPRLPVLHVPRAEPTHNMDEHMDKRTKHILSPSNEQNVNTNSVMNIYKGGWGNSNDYTPPKPNVFVCT
jgi:hypothetical protein